MSSLDPPADDPAPRPEVVQAVYSSLMDADPSKLAPLSASGTRITPAEREQAESLYAASLLASHDQRSRFLEAMQVLIGDRTFPPSAPPTWPELFDGLTPERLTRLRSLYDALPDPARAEYDRRYGRPENI